MESTEAAAADRRRRPKGDKRERTRAKLLEAARQLVREKGYANTTLQDVASRAGMTSGAIYGNFKNRDELFVSLAEAHWTPIRPKVKAGATFGDVMHSLAAATLAALPDREKAAVGRLTGMAYTLTQDQLRDRVREMTAQSYALGASWLRAAIDERDLPMAPEPLVRVIHALTEGLVFQRLLTPELVPDEVFYEAFAALATPRRAASQ
jgi:AcrR family transcriptional regulator